MFGQNNIISRPIIFPSVVTSNFKKSTNASPSHRDSKTLLSIASSIHRTGISYGNSANSMPHPQTAMIPGLSFVTGRSITVTNKFNDQTKSYVDTLTSEQTKLTNSNNIYLDQRYSSNPNPTIKELRNLGDWGAVKNLVVRDELMKLQICGKTDLPLSDAQFTELSQKIKGLDLSNMNDVQINEIINDILRPNDQIYLDALKTFKTTGKIDNCFQVSKVELLSEHLKTIDLGKITAKEFKYIKDNFIEKIEIHHRTSISSDPTKQSNIDNLDALNTSKHRAKHLDPDTKKINFRRKTNEASLDRRGELKTGNKDRVMNRNLLGLGVAVAIGMGTGFTIGFVVSLAQNGVNPNSIKYAFVAGKKQSITGGVTAAVGFTIGKTVGNVLSKTITKSITSLIGSNVSEETMKRIAELCNMG